MNKSHSNIVIYVFWGISGLIGFIVNVVTLIGLISDADVGNVPTPALSSNSLFRWGSLTLEWKELTLVLLLYVGVAFFVVSRPSSRKFNIRRASLFYLFFILALLWVMEFYPFGTTQTYRRIIEVWLAGLVILTVFSNVKPSTQAKIFFLLSPLIALPALALLERGFEQTSWSEAIKTSLILGVAALIAPFAVIGIPALVVGILYSGAIASGLLTLVLVGGVGRLLGLVPSKGQAEVLSDLRMELLQEICDLDETFETGMLAETTYREKRASLKAKLGELEGKENHAANK